MKLSTISYPSQRVPSGALRCGSLKDDGVGPIMGQPSASWLNREDFSGADKAKKEKSGSIILV